MLAAKWRRLGPPPQALPAAVRTLVLAAEGVNLGCDRSLALGGTALVRIAVGTASVPATLAARLPGARVVTTVFASDADRLVAAGNSACVLVAGLAVRLDFPNVETAAFELTGVVAARPGAGFNFLIARQAS